MQLHLTFVKRTERTSQRTGKPFTSLSIKATEYGDKYLGGFDGAETRNWKAGDVVEVEVKDDGKYLNFSVPKAKNSPQAPAGDINRVELLVRTVLTEIQMVRGLLGEFKDEQKNLMGQIFQKITPIEEINDDAAQGIKYPEPADEPDFGQY